MNKKLMTLCAIIMLAFSMLAFSACAHIPQEQSPPYIATQPTNTTLDHFYGQWQGLIAPIFATVTLDIIDEAHGVLFTAQEHHIEFMPIDWQIDSSQLILGMNSEEYRITMVLDLSDDGNSISGTFTQHGVSSPIEFAKISDTPTIGEFNITWAPVSIQERISQLNAYPIFADDARIIQFTYDLNRRDLYADLINDFDLDTITSGLYDTDLMRALLVWITNNFNHNGASGMPANVDAMSIVNYMRQNPAGINCRGLAILLAETLRLYGIPAKHITVFPPEDNHPVHVITHAWSQNLQQWVMLDPTFGMYVIDKHGNFMDLLTLRAAFASQAPMHASATARRNGQAVSIDQYIDFMADYLFRFSTGTNFTFGSEETGTGTTRFMLVPYGFDGSVSGIRTTSANAFFAPPNQYND